MAARLLEMSGEKQTGIEKIIRKNRYLYIQKSQGAFN